MDYTKLRPGTSIPASLLLFVGFNIVALSISAGGITTNADWCSDKSLVATPILTSGVGLLIAFYRHAARRRETEERSLISILANDLSFRSFATLSILSVIYAIAQGICCGAAFGLLIQAIQVGTCWGQSWILTPYQSVTLAGCSILLLVLMRLAIEGYALIYRVGSDISRFVAAYDTNKEFRQ